MFPLLFINNFLSRTVLDALIILKHVIHDFAETHAYNARRASCGAGVCKSRRDENKCNNNYESFEIESKTSCLRELSSLFY